MAVCETVAQMWGAGCVCLVQATFLLSVYKNDLTPLQDFGLELGVGACYAVGVCLTLGVATLKRSTVYTDL